MQEKTNGSQEARKVNAKYFYEINPWESLGCRILNYFELHRKLLLREMHVSGPLEASVILEFRTYMKCTYPTPGGVDAVHVLDL